MRDLYGYTRSVTCAAACTALAACGGGGGGGADGTSSTFAGYDAIGVSIVNEADPLDFGNIADVEGPAGVPTTGTASYQGVAFAEVSNTNGASQIQGRLMLDADFANSLMDGSIDAIVDQANEALSGSISLDGGIIRRDINVLQTYTFGGPMQGTITDINGNEITVDGFYNGDFYGAGEEYVNGRFSGTFASNGTTATITNGQFVASELP